MAETPRISVPPTRRGIVAAAGGVGLAAALAACGSSDSSDNAKSDSEAPAAPTTTDAGAPPSTTDSANGGGGGGGTTLGKSADIPVGGGKIYPDHKVVVTQPTAGQFKAFSATCTHQGCLVTSVSDGTINCPCHGSKFHVADGSVANGPASSPLATQKVTVKGDEVELDA
ncbi:Rieske (2Fe-2S) protein [Streptomyces sp. NPDC051976]|uniref:Rieske (2Fe-2S) protein n=1 Tax=Streptomyces sp. NPDC051976 TaxID=3154947 RepID=UPI0034434F19